MGEKKTGFVLAGVNIGREVLSGPFRERPDGRLEVAEGVVMNVRPRKILQARAHELELRQKDEALEQAWVAIEAELDRFGSGRIMKGRNCLYYDFTDARELAERWEKLVNDAVARWKPKRKEKTISLARLNELTDKYGALIALRDPDGFREARSKKRGLLSMIADYPDLKAEFDREMEEEVPPAPPSGVPGPGDPEPLERHRVIHLEEMPWDNPLPERGMAAADLAAYWAWALETREARLEQAMQNFPREKQTENYYRWLKERWKQIRMLEAILAVLHRIVAPDATYLCGAGCNHLGGGTTPEQAKRFLDTLDAFRAIRAYESEENYTAQYALRAFRRALAGEAPTAT